MSWRYTILGTPRTKKNSQRITSHGGILPSAAFEAYEKGAVFIPAIPTSVIAARYAHEVELRRAKAERRKPRACATDRPSVVPIGPLNMCAVVYRATDVGDLFGYLQGIADMLQNAGVIADDKWIKMSDGSRLEKDPKTPRVEVLLTPLGPPVLL